MGARSARVPFFIWHNNMKQYKLVIAYDGTDYSGWIQQPNRASVVQTLQVAFARVFKKKIVLLGASKTDAGVHALGQVAVFKADIAVDAEKMRWAWNNALPSSIVIRSLVSDEQFHPHVNVKYKIYYYHFFVDRPLPFIARYGYYMAHQFDWQRFEQALQCFVGTHDFYAFYTGSEPNKNTVRTIERIKLEFIKRYSVYRVVIAGERFLRHMVRRMVGAAFTVVSDGSVSHDDIRMALQRRSVNCKLTTAPANGLMLYKIIYKEAA